MKNKTTYEKGLYGETVAGKALVKSGIKIKRAIHGTGPDFITERGVTIDVKFSTVRYGKKRKDGSRPRAWSFNCHHGGDPQDADFFVCVLVADGKNRIFVFPRHRKKKHSIRVSERQIEYNVFKGYEENFGLIKKAKHDDPANQIDKNGFTNTAKVRMNQRYFALNILKCQPVLWSMCLGGTRNLGYELARTVAHILGTSVDLWMDPKSSPAERIRAWQKFQKRVAK